MSTSDRLYGVISRFDVSKGYGFLLTDHGDGKMSLFYHVSSCGAFLPEKDRPVTFRIGAGKKGPIAIDLQVATVEEIHLRTALATLAGGVS